MKNLIAFLISLILIGCAPCHNDISQSFILPPELKDYKVIQLYGRNAETIYVLVKKQGEDRTVIGTTSPQGKVTYHTIVIDGVAYGKLENE